MLALYSPKIRKRKPVDFLFVIMICNIAQYVVLDALLNFVHLLRLNISDITLIQPGELCPILGVDFTHADQM